MAKTAFYSHYVVVGRIKPARKLTRSAQIRLFAPFARALQLSRKVFPLLSLSLLYSARAKRRRVHNSMRR